MNLVADTYEYVIGVDTHVKTHTYAVVAATTGVLIDTETFPTTAAGMARAITWIGRRTAGERLAAVEGTSSAHSHDATTPMASFRTSSPDDTWGYKQGCTGRAAARVKSADPAGFIVGLAE